MATQKAIPSMNQPASRSQRQGLLIIGVVAVAAVVLAVVVIALAGTGTVSADINYAELPQSRTADGGFILGNPDAPVTIVEFADYGCPHCVEYHGTMQQFIKDYVVTGKAKFEYRNFPTAGGDLTRFVAQLQECAEDQRAGAFWESYALLYRYSESGRFNRDVGRTLAQDLNMNYSELLTCSSDASQVTTDINFGRTSQITGTPAVMIRYGDGSAQFIQYNGQVYNRGSVPGSVLGAVVEQAQ
jgi:protein-disulfide isomerase